MSVGMSQEATPVQRAALALHALSRADRDWVLQGLTDAQQATLQPLLSELEELGIPREVDLVPVAHEGERTVTGSAGSRFEGLDAAGRRRLAHVLGAEPPRVAAMVLAGGAGPWRAQLLGALPAAFARQVERAARADAAPALCEAVAVEVARAVAGLDGPAGGESRWHWLRHCFAAFRRSR